MEKLNIYEAPEISLIYLEDIDILTGSLGDDDTDLDDPDSILPW